MEHSVDNLTEIIDAIRWENNFEIDYLLLPSSSSLKQSSSTSTSQLWIDWRAIAYMMQNHNGPKDRVRRNSLVYTPHNGHIYCITGSLKHLNSNSSLSLRDGSVTTYKQYYKKRYVLLTSNAYLTDCCKSIFHFSILHQLEIIILMMSCININVTLFSRYGIQLCNDQEPLLNGRRLFQLKNYLKCRQQKDKGIACSLLF